MPNNSEVTTKEFAKIRGSKGGADWSQPWSRAQALAELSEESRSVLQSQYGYDGNSVTELVCAGLFRRKDIPA